MSSSRRPRNDPRMELLKNHYEKILLSLVLLGVVIYAVMLPGRINEEKQKIDDLTREIERGPVKPIKTNDFTPHWEAVKRVQNSKPVEISGPHNLFNPVRWVRLPSGERVKLADDARGLFKFFLLTKITPLYYAVVFDGPKGPADALRYYFPFTDECAPTTGGRRPTLRSHSPKTKDDRGDLSILREITGPVENPTVVVLELIRDKERITLGVGKDKAYRRQACYEVDAKYDPENKTFKGLRLNSQITFGGQTYKVIAITDSGITIESILNQQRYPVPLTPAP